MLRAPRPCNWPECENLIRSLRPGPCPVHRKLSGHRALYDSEWDAFSQSYRLTHPVCERCHAALSKETNHIESVALAPHRRLDPTNVEALCHTCHRAVTPKRVRTDGPIRRRTP